MSDKMDLRTAAVISRTKDEGTAVALLPAPVVPRAVLTCKKCQRSYDLCRFNPARCKCVCGREDAFQCAKCGRKFPHKQNCVYHLKRKHKIVFDTIDQYLSSGLLVDMRQAGTSIPAIALSLKDMKLNES